MVSAGYSATSGPSRQSKPHLPMSSRPFRVLFVCLGNICRSPAAEVVCRAHLDRAGEQRVQVDSCGTAAYHIGQRPDARMLAALQRAGFVYGGHRARQFRREDFSRFDLIIPQDEENRADLLALAVNAEQKSRIVPMSRWFAAGEARREVPDPYYGDASDFDDVVSLLDAAMPGLLRDIDTRLQRGEA